MREWLLSLEIPQQPTGGAWSTVLQPYQAWLHGQKVREEITASTIEYKTELIDNIRRTWDGFDAFDLAELSEKRLGDWQVAHRTQYSPTRTNGATTVLREMVEIRAVKENVLTKAAAAAALPGLRYVKVRYDYKRLVNNLPEPRQTVQLRDELYRRCQMAGSRGRLAV